MSLTIQPHTNFFINGTTMIAGQLWPLRIEVYMIANKCGAYFSARQNDPVGIDDHGLFFALFTITTWAAIAKIDDNCF